MGLARARAAAPGPAGALPLDNATSCQVGLEAVLGLRLSARPGRMSRRAARLVSGVLKIVYTYRAEVRRSFITKTVRDESQVTPQGRHR